MARQPSGREIALVVVLGAILVGWLFFKDDARLFGGGVPAVTDEKPLGEAPRVERDRLISQAEDYDPDGRNLFQYYIPPPPKAPYVPPPPPPPPPEPVIAAPVQEQPAVPLPPPVPQPPNIPYRYLGYLGPKDDKIAVLEQGGEMQLARAGEVIERQFRVVEFKYDSVVMGYVDERFKGRTTELRMSRR